MGRGRLDAGRRHAPSRCRWRRKRRAEQERRVVDGDLAGHLPHRQGLQAVTHPLRRRRHTGVDGPLIRSSRSGRWWRSAEGLHRRSARRRRTVPGGALDGPGRTRTCVERIMSAQFAGLLTLASGFLVRAGGVVGPSIGRAGNTTGDRAVAHPRCAAPRAAAGLLETNARERDPSGGPTLWPHERLLELLPIYTTAGQRLARSIPTPPAHRLAWRSPTARAAGLGARS